MCSLPRKVCTIGAFSCPASATTSSCAPAQPAPQNSVTRSAPLSMPASLSISRFAGRTIGGPVTSQLATAAVAGFRATSPGITTTATPRLATATRMARLQDLRQLIGVGDELDVVAALLEQAPGWVSWK